jgi:hypothetical protein
MTGRELACATLWDSALPAHLGVLLDGQMEVWDCGQAHAGGHPADHPSQALDCPGREKARREEEDVLLGEASGLIHRPRRARSE